MTKPAATAAPAARYFAVQGGHVHTAGCGHASAARRGGKTKAVHVPELDGKTEAEVAELIGDARCAHCFHFAPAKARKLTQADMDLITGRTARKEAAKADRARKAALEADPVLLAITAAFEAAKAAEDHDTAGKLYGARLARRKALGI